ncbi:hypothetical protein [Sarcina ventriculi]|uniref:hypothetical protein n=1 Tax=Sarcina ventriculi TaxID=1267 RepID=UPI0018AB1D53|nr:hypothetical protein [Sarcina ventriculi]
MNKTIKKIIPISMAMLFVAPMTTAYADVNANNKEENVYINLKDDGSVEGIYVVNEFDAGNQTTITDYGKYSSVLNLSTNEEIKVNGDMITFNTDDNGMFYYQGNMESTKIPWNIDISYYLDDKEVQASSLAGKSGKLKIAISIKDNEDMEDTFFDNYLLQMTATFNSEKCKDIVSEQATIANVGDTKQLTYTILAGSNSEFTIEAAVTDFEMDPITINAVPMNISIDDIDVSDLKDSLIKLRDGVAKIDDGSSDLYSGSKDLSNGTKSLLDGTNSLSSGAEKLQNGFKTLKEAMDTLNSNSFSLTNGSKEVLNALNTINSALDSLNEASNQVQQLVEGSNEFASGMKELAEKNNDLYNKVNPILEVVREKLAQIKDTNFKEEFDSITNKEDYLNAYNDAKAKLAENPDDEALKIYIALFDHIIEIANKYDKNVTSAGNQAHEKIEKEYEKICELDDGIDAQHKAIQELNNKYKNELNPAIEKLPSLLSKLTELKTALNTLVNSYATLDSGINSYTGAYEQIVKGYQTLYSGIGDLEKGVESLNTGTKTLYDGTVSLEDGAEELNDGTSEMRDKTKNIDTEIDDKINNMLDEFKNTDYKPESFASSENGEINAVQFVMKTKGIEINNEVQEEVKEEHLNFFQKIIRLFFKK